MIVQEMGAPGAPVIILLHGGGLSWWACAPAAQRLTAEYHVVMPVIAGHGEAADQTFVSIQASAQEVLAWAAEHIGGHVHGIAGLSLGAQIAAETIARQPDFARYAVLESALCVPMPLTTAAMVPMERMCAGLVKQRWFAQAQAKSLYLPKELFETYYADSSRMSADTLAAIAQSNGNYPLPEGLRETKARVLVAAGGKELRVMRRSAQMLSEAIPESRLYFAPGLKHGEWSLCHTIEYTDTLKAFFSGK